MDFTRRQFVQTASLLTAGSAVGPTSAFAHAVASADPSGPVLPMGSIFPYGAVYFRKSNPPREDWSRDHATAARLGMNTFRHWFLWGSIEVAPGRFDWSDYDQMMDLAAANGLKVVIAELVTSAPEWAFRRFASARFVSGDGKVLRSSISPSSATGGFPGLCLDNDDARTAAEGFLTALIERYRRHPALLGYDLWNENTFNGGTPQQMFCYCEATRKRLRDWLEHRYGSLQAVAKAWRRYSYESWDDVQPPDNFSGYPESLDWLQFRIDDAFDLFDWRIRLFRKLDPAHLITAHGVAGTLETFPSSAHNEWMSASRVDVWGLTWIAARKGDEPWRQYQALDLVRGGCRGKPFWHAEAQGGPLWMQPQVVGRPKEDGRIPDAEDVRLWNLVSCAGGARGILYCRWRPLLDGPLFDAFAPAGMDGSVVPNTEMAGRIATWANGHPDLWRSAPVKGELGLAFVPEAELFNYVQQGATGFYAQSVEGAYQAFFSANIQADFVTVEDLAAYKVIYLAYPLMLKSTTVALLRSYVHAGGFLICEGLPGYFGDGGRAGAVQPSTALSELFGVRQSAIEFDPDLSENLELQVQGRTIFGRYFRQEYELAGGRASGAYANGAISAVENVFGLGRTFLIGSFPGSGYFHHHGKETRDLYLSLLQSAGVVPHVSLDDTAVQARLHQGPGGTYLWVTNPTGTRRKVTATLAASAGSFLQIVDLWGGQAVTFRDQQLTMNVPARDAIVARLL